MELVTKKPLAKVLAGFAMTVLLPVVVAALEAYATGSVDWKTVAATALGGLAASTAAWLKSLSPDDVVVIEASRELSEVE